MHRHRDVIDNDREQPVTLTVEQAGRLLGISRGAAYRAAAAGELPTIRFGRRILVPTARLLRLLGVDHDAVSTGDCTTGTDTDPTPANLAVGSPDRLGS